MPRVEHTPASLKEGAKILTSQQTTIRLNSPAIEILIGGPYKGRDGVMHTYGHMALRVITLAFEKIYDFGRYGKVSGDFGAEGEGILRIWDSFNSYIAGENAYSRTTKGFLYLVSDDQAKKVVAHYDELVAGTPERRAKQPNQKEYKLVKNYHALTNNCATMSLAGARIALPGIESNSPSANQGRGMSSAEKMAARATHFGMWPSEIFMPQDVQVMLEKNTKIAPKKISVYGPITK